MRGFQMRAGRPARCAACAAAAFLVTALSSAQGVTGLQSAQGDSRLLDAVKRRDLTAVRALVRAHVDVNTAQPDGATALAWAVHLGDHGMAELLLGAGARVDLANEYGETPLTLACANGDAVLVEELLKAGADAGAVRANGETALMIAAGAGSVYAVRQLVAHGAAVDAAEPRKGQTALMWAAAEGRAGVVQALVGMGAKVNAASGTGFTALVFAAARNDAASVRTLLAAGADPNYTLPSGKKVLLVAAAYRSTRAAAALVDGGADPNVADRGGTILHAAAQAGDVDLVKKLLAKGVSLNARTAKRVSGSSAGAASQDPGELTPLLVAARANQQEVMRVLAAAGADPSLKAGDGSTLLMAAAARGTIGTVRYAYQLDPRIDAVDDAGATVMHASVISVSGRSPDQICEVIQFLADKGAGLDVRDAAGRTPRQIAGRESIDKAVELLTALIKKSGATPRSSVR
jgi:ankyrin repeat protein